MSGYFFDTHAHLDFEFLSKDRARLLRQCHDQNIRGWLIPSTGRERWSEVLELCDSEVGCVAALGLHPFFVDRHCLEDVAELRQIIHLHRNRVVAIGECGLDATVPDMTKQKALLRAQLDLARDLDMPVVLHSRKTHSELVGELRRVGWGKGVIHAFTGNVQQLEAFVNLGLKIGVGPAIVWPRSTKTREAICAAPLASLLLETDAPEMPCPGEIKGQASLLGLLRVFDALSALRCESSEHLAQQLFENSCELFNLQVAANLRH